MDNLISRKMAIIQLSHNKTGDDDCDVVIQRDIETIKSLPSAQPEIIHCRDCNHWKNNHICENLSRFGTFETIGDFYCGYAEGREDG